MLRLTAEHLDNALTAIQMHGYGDFFPEPPELSLLVDRWDDIRAELVQVDLDLYEGHDVTFAFAPKSRLNVRRVALLHPYDPVFYTALVLALRDGITSSRLAARENRVFSYHAEGAAEASPIRLAWMATRRTPLQVISADAVWVCAFRDWAFAAS